MECPRCNNEVSEHDKVCPHCKKVLLLECPVCKKLSRTPLCPECGFVIVSKCHKCGQLNKTINGTCKKCGFSTYKSISMNEAEIEEFACLAITFPNLDDLRPALKNKQIYNKFFKKLKGYIFEYGRHQDNRVQYVDNNFIIKYYKEFSMSSSANKAVTSAVELMNKIAEISFKLKKSKGVKMACKMTILKRNLDNDNESFNTGLNIKLINTDSHKKEDYSDGLQLITDQYINALISRKYKQELIYSSQVNDELIEFYEFPIKSQLKPIVIEDDKEKKENRLTKPKKLPKVADLSEEKVSVDLYSNKAIDIKTRCEFLKLSGIDVPLKLQELLEQNVFVTIKANENLALNSSLIMDAIRVRSNKILHVVCSEGFVYDPYACFKELIASFLGFDTKLANLDAASKQRLKTFDKDDYIYKLLVHTPLVDIEPQVALKQYMEIFYKFIELQKGSVFFIENFDLIDETSLEILISLVEKFSELGISFVVTVPETYFAHKEIKELLYLGAYKEIEVQKTPFERLLQTIPEDISEIKDSFYLKKLEEQFMGGFLYFQHALQYLRDTHVFISHDGKLLLNAEKTIIFPSSLEQLLTKRFASLDENECFILAYASFLGNNMVIGILNDLGVEGLDIAIRSLCEKKLITINNFIVEVENYRLLQKVIRDFLDDDVKKLITQNILEKLHAKTLEVIKSLGLITESQMTIFELSKYAISHGDFNAYLRNCKRFLTIIEKIPKKALLPEIKEAKNYIYSTLALYINKYPSHKIYAISKVIFEDCLRRKDDLKIMNISSLMLDSALMGENYILAQQSLHNVLTRMLNPALTEGNENIQSKFFFYSCINVKILFYAGKFKQCIEVLDNILLSINQDLFMQLGASNVSKDAFVSYFMSILVYGALARVLTCDNSLDSFLKRINYMFSQDLPGGKAVKYLEMLIHNQNIDFDEEFSSHMDGISQIIRSFIVAFELFDGDYNTFAQNIYQVKLLARGLKDSFWGLLSDLLIGYAYQKLNSFVKAKVIFKDVASIAQKSGMIYVSILSNWFMANLYYDIHEYDNATKLIGDNIIIISRSTADDMLPAILSYILQVNILVAQGRFDTDLQPILYKIKYGCEKFNLQHLQSMLVDYDEYLEKYRVNQELKNNENNTQKNEENAKPEVIASESKENV